MCRACSLWSNDDCTSGDRQYICQNCESVTNISTYNIDRVIVHSRLHACYKQFHFEITFTMELLTFYHCRIRRPRGGVLPPPRGKTPCVDKVLSFL